MTVCSFGSAAEHGGGIDADHLEDGADRRDHAHANGEHEQRARQHRRHGDGKFRFGHLEHPHDEDAERHAHGVADNRRKHRLDQDDLVDVAGRGAQRAQRRELVEVVLGARIERLRHDHDADDDAERGACDERHAGARLEHPAADVALAELVVRDDVGVGKAEGEPLAHLVEVGAVGELHADEGRLLGGRIRHGARVGNGSEHVRHRRERADAVRDGRHRDLHAVDLGLVAQALDAELLEIDGIDSHAGRRQDRLLAAELDVPRQRAVGQVVEADDGGGRAAAAGAPPVDEADEHLVHLADARCRQDRLLLAPDEREGVVEALGLQRHHPEVRRRSVDDGRDETLRALVHAELHRHQHDGEDDADEGHRQAQRVVEQVLVGELVHHRQPALAEIGSTRGAHAVFLHGPRSLHAHRRLPDPGSLSAGDGGLPRRSSDLAAWPPATWAAPCNLAACPAVPRGTPVRFPAVVRPVFEQLAQMLT